MQRYIAISGKLEGYFKDIKRMDGAVIGTSYEQATDEIEVNVLEENDEISIEVKMLYPDKVPYTTFDEFGVKSYQIRDDNEKLIMEEASTELVKIERNYMLFEIPVNNLADGEYTLIITSFVGASKADQPLELHGNWECVFALGTE